MIEMNKFNYYEDNYQKLTRIIQGKENRRVYAKL